MNWNYKHNTTLPEGTIVNCPNSILRGNVIYVSLDGYTDQAAVTAENASAEIGSMDYPYKTIKLAIADYTTHSKRLFVFGDGEHKNSNVSGSGVNTKIFSDNKFGRFNCNGSYFWNSGNDQINIYDAYIYNCSKISNGANPNSFIYGCVVDITTYDPYYRFYHSILIGTTIDAYEALDCMIFNATVDDFTNDQNNIYYNCTKTFGVVGDMDNKHIFWLGSITIGSNTYDLSEAIALEKSEATIISEMNSLFGSSLSTSNFGIKEVNFINTSKGNFLLDFINYASNVSALISKLKTFGTELDIIKLGIKLDWDSTEADSDYIFSASSPHYDSDDGFSGLTCQNLNADGTIIDTANDTVAVSKILDLGSQRVIDFINQFGAFGSGDFEFDELYIRAVLTGDVEDVFNSNNYTAFYSNGVFTCNLPRFILNRLERCNKENNVALGKIENGLYDIDDGRNTFLIGCQQFQIIAVKRGV